MEIHVLIQSFWKFRDRSNYIINYLLCNERLMRLN
jgi:hypothetical protein